MSSRTFAITVAELGNSDSQKELEELLENWSRENNSSYNPLNTLKRIAALLERETEIYYKSDPDPFDDRHPARANPQCMLGHLMKLIFKNEDFMEQLVQTYILSNRDQGEVLSSSLRLLLDLLPGLETSVVFQENEGMVSKLFNWAEKSSEPLRSYATGLLAGAMEIQDIATNNKEKNGHLVPLMLRRLRHLQYEMGETSTDSPEKHKENRHFEMFAQEVPCKGETSDQSNLETEAREYEETPEKHRKKEMKKRALSPSYYSEELFRFKKPKMNDSCAASEASTSSWAEMESYIISTHCLDPLTNAMKQRLILQYLTQMAEYQEFLSTAFENNSLELIFRLINLRENKDGRLAFEALKYCATLLCHKKFAVDFLQANGIQKLLEVIRPSLSATGVSLCLYYLSYFEDAMERVSLLSENVLSDLVSYMLWLIECSHDSSRCHAAMFFSQCFAFKIMLDLFDKKDGLRRVFNVLSTQGILNVEEPPEHLSDDAVYTMRQAARHVSLALKKYFEAHLIVKADCIRNSNENNDGSQVQETITSRAMKLTPEVVQENIELMLEYMPTRFHWTPEITFHKLNGVQLLSQVVAMAPDWNNFPGKSETIRNVLDVLYVLTITPRSQLLLLETVPLPDNVATPAISAIIGLAEGDVIVTEPDVQKSALNVIINCVCGPVDKLGMGRFVTPGNRKKIHMKGDDVLSKMWNGIRLNNGIMVLLKLLSTKTPITDADSIRALACRALVGLSRSETVKQIISKLPLFNNGQLQYLMREPVLQDKRQDHIKFCKYASQLLEKVSGKMNNAIDASLEDIRRASIVARTRIIYQENELLQLIHEYLITRGLHDAAVVLQKEANLPRCLTPPVIHPTTPHLHSPATPKPMSRQIIPVNPTPAPSHSSSHQLSQCSASTSSPQLSTPGTPHHIKFSLNAKHVQSPSVNVQNKFSVAKSKFSRDNTQSPALKPRLHGRPPGEMNLDKIVTEYLRKQHALCRNPVSTCPPMSLFNPHRCPDPRGKNSAPSCVTNRIFRRSVEPRHGGRDGMKCNRKYVYSKFRPLLTYRDDEDEGFSCCTFSSDESLLLLGTFSGDLKFTNLLNGEELNSFSCHPSALAHCQVSKNGKLVLTSTAWGTTTASSLWRYTDNTMENKLNFEDNYAAFSNQVQDRIIGTKDEKAHVYDASNGALIATFYDADKANNYKANMAVFNPTDELVLNDGVLWDIRTSKSIHKFDKFNQYISGKFHPMGLEILINSEIWDIRTFHLLHTVPALDQCQLQFNNYGDVIFATHIDGDADPEDENYRSPYGSAFRTFDATDYKNICTVDLKTRSIFDLSIHNSDLFMAIVENGTKEVGTDESVCRLYEIGKVRDVDDDQLEEEEERVEDEDDEEDEDDLSNLDLGGSDEDVEFELVDSAESSIAGEEEEDNASEVEAANSNDEDADDDDDDDDDDNDGDDDDDDDDDEDDDDDDDDDDDGDGDDDDDDDNNNDDNNEQNNGGDEEQDLDDVLYQLL